MISRRVILSLLLLSFFYSCKSNRISLDGEVVDSRVRVNQMGYYVSSPKLVVVGDSIEAPFYVVDSFGNVVFKGILKSQEFWRPSGEKVSRGDFSSLEKTGRFQVLVPSIGLSPSFVIDSVIYGEAFKASLKSYYYQRASMDLDSQYAGAWARKAGHPDTACILHESTGKEGVVNSSKGWYDAGDFGKYVVNAGITVGTMLSLYERFPALVPDRFSNIPESGNGQSDLLDEVKYELDWLKSMQDEDGGVFFKVAGLSWPGFVLPADDTMLRYVIGKTTTSSLCFAANMAQAARVFKEIDSSYASDCLDRAKKAYVWAQQNSAIAEPAETGGSGAYSDHQQGWMDLECSGSQYLVEGNEAYKDEFLWAAAELFISTGEEPYSETVKKSLTEMKFTDVPTWWDLQGMAYYSLLTVPGNLDKNTRDAVLAKVTDVAEKHRLILKENPYRIPYECFFWGSNASFLNIAVLFSYMYDLTGDRNYYDALTETVDYVFGKNPLGVCYVTGFGSTYPHSIHHRQCSADGIDEPIPGFVVGGPNNVRQDDITKVSWGTPYCYSDPARSYVDDEKSYASNEIAINWNAPLVHILGYLKARERL